MTMTKKTAFLVASLLALALCLPACDGPDGQEDAGPDGGADAADGDGSDADEGPCPADMALVDDGQGLPFCIDRFEQPGEGRVPTTGAAWFNARTACVDERKQLCFEEQWLRACVGTSPAACVGPLVPSGSRADCVSGFGAYDMAGNVSEWTATPGGSVSWMIRGGSSRSGEVGCEVREEVNAEDRREDLGFRCCRAAR